MTFARPRARRRAEPVVVVRDAPMSTPLERLLAWERELLRAASLEQWLERLARLPEDATGEYEVALLVADPTHELRQLVAGVGAILLT